MSKVYVWDCEILVNFFSATFLNVDTLEVHSFYIHKSKDQRQEIINFLTDCTLLIGYNNLNFDYRLLHMILTGNPTIGDLYGMAQRIVSDERLGWVPKLIPQLDLLKLNHYDFEGRQASLKWLQINMGMKSVQDMPFKHDHHVRVEDIPIILKYNLNDVEATYELWKRSQDLITLREMVSEKYRMDMSNYSNAKMGEMILLRMISDKTKIDIKTLSKCRTVRKDLRLKDVILPSVSFVTPEFQKIYDTFAGMTVTKDSEKPEMLAMFDNVPFYFGMGGLHACRGSGIYTDVDSIDVRGYYPALSVAQKFSPQHFGKNFVDVYGQIAIERGMYKKGDPMNQALKEAQVSVFGKSRSEFSPFYDLKLFYQITINGQLLLAMLCERITKYGAGKILMANTDGIEIQVTNRETFDWLCKEWQEAFGVVLEFSKYKKLIIRDVNNFLAIYED